MVRVDMVAGQPTAPHEMYCSPYGDAYYHGEHYFMHPPEMCPQQMCTLHGDYGPVTVPMVSTNSSQPMAVPVQVPPGHVLQQIVDENGTLRHVILSPQPPGPPHLPPHLQHGPPPPQHYGPANGSNGPQQFYGPPGFPPHHFHPHGPQMPPPPPQHPSHHMPHSPPHSYHKDERAHRQHAKLRRKIEQMNSRNNHLGYNSSHSTPAPSPRKEFSNGSRARGPGSAVGGTSSEGEGSSSAATSVQGDEEESRPLLDFLSSLQTPLVSDVTSYSALVQWSSPVPLEGAPVPPYNGEIAYELLLGEKGRYKAIYNGPALSCRVQDLRPGTEYSVCLQAQVEEFTGAASGAAVVKTPPCEPGPPTGLRATSRTKTSLQLRWAAAVDNGAHIQHYILQYDEGKGGDFVDLCKPRNKQHSLQKLEASTRYRFRLAAVNDVGRGPWSEESAFSTCGSPPPPPSPPTLIQTTAHSIFVRWQRRPGDEDFTLQMENEHDRHGFLPVYAGREIEHNCEGLIRYSDYKFRLQANNEEGGSRWSDEIIFRTQPERPGPPSKPTIKGKIHAHSFRVRWEPPIDRGGTDIQNYTLEINSGSGFEVVFVGPDQEATCDRLSPGTHYQVRVSCKTSGGISNWSDIQSVTTEPVVPDTCLPPILSYEPKPHSLAIKWQKPDYDGGSPILEYNVEILEDNNSRLVYKGNETECTVLALLPGRQYSLRVRAFNRVGGGSWSEPLEVTSGAAPPDVPSPPRAIAKSPYNIFVQWDEPACNGGPICDYQLEMSSSNGEDSTFTSVFQGLQLNYDVKNLAPFSSYYFKLCASNKAGASKWSEISEVSTPGAPPSSPPVVKVEVTATRALLTWDEPPCNGHQIQYYRIDMVERIITTQEPVLEYLLEDLLPETTYRIRVQAVNEIGIGNFSPTLKVDTLPLPPPPPPIICTQQAHNFLKLKWGEGKNTDFTQYTVEMQNSRRKEYQCVYQGTSLSFRVKKLQESMKYRFRICATNDAGGQGDFSEDYEFETTPAPPATLKTPKLLEVTTNSLQLEWGSTKPLPDEPTTYIVHCSRTKDQDYKQVYRGSDTMTTVNNLESGCEYAFRVCAEREVDGSILHGSWSPLLVATILAAPLAQSVSTLAVPRKAPKRPVAPFSITDNHYAFLIIFAVCCIAILAANGIKQFIDSHDSV